MENVIKTNKGQLWKYIKNIKSILPNNKGISQLQIRLLKEDPESLTFLQSIKNFTGLKKINVNISDASVSDKIFLQNLAVGIRNHESLDELKLIQSNMISGGIYSKENVRNLTNCFSRNLTSLKLQFGQLGKYQLDIILSETCCLQNLSHFKISLTKEIDYDSLIVLDYISSLAHLKTIKLDITFKKQSSQIYHGKNCSSFWSECQSLIINVNFFQNLPVFNTSENLKYLSLIIDKMNKDTLNSFQKVHMKCLQSVETLILKITHMNKMNWGFVRFLLQNLSSLRQLELIQTTIVDISPIFPLVNLSNSLECLYLEYQLSYFQSFPFPLVAEQLMNVRRVKHLRINKVFLDQIEDEKEIYKVLMNFSSLLTLKLNFIKDDHDLKCILKAKRLVVFGANIQNNFRKINQLNK